MRLGIRSKVILVPTAILLVAVTSNVLLVGTRFRTDYMQSMQASVQVIADNLKLQMERLFELGFALQDISGFDDQCREVLRQHPHLSYVYVVGANGNILFRSHKDGVPSARPGARTGADTKLLIVHDSHGGEHYSLASPIDDHYGKTVAWAIVAFPRNVLDSKINGLTAWLIGVAGMSLGVTAALLWGTLSVWVTRPLSSLLGAIGDIHTSGDLSKQVTVQRNDEIGELGTAFNALLHSVRDRDAQILRNVQELRHARDELELRVQERTADLRKANHELQAEMERRRDAEAKREQVQMNLVEASRRAGMADVATSVLHNVGNVLNSVNVAAQLVQDRLQQSQLSTLRLAVTMMQDHAADLPQFIAADERGKQLPAFLGKLADHLEQERAQAQVELEGLASSVNHMKEIVGMQQSLARIAGVVGDVKIGELMEDALKINQAGLLRHGVTVERDFDPELVIQTDRHKVLQILINVVSNAKYALTSSDKPQKLMTLRVRQTPEKTVQISVIDNGVGIEAKNMNKIFSLGFTTKREGHGFGLHGSSLAAGQIGGSLKVNSDGPGAGAVFTLTLPLTAGGNEQCPQPTTASCVASS